MSPDPGAPSIQVSEQHLDEVPATAADLHLVVTGTRLFTGRAALREAAEVRRLCEALQAAGVGEGEVSLERVHLDATKGLLTRSSTATYGLRVRCADLTRLPALLDVVADQKGVSLGHIDWDYAGAAERKGAWLRDCIGRARAKAEAAAEALGVEIEGLQALREETLGEPRTLDEAVPMMEGFALRPRASIATELQSLELAPSKRMGVRVEITYRVRERSRAGSPQEKTAMPTTPENLQIAFAGESQANRKYLAYARKAEQDGFPNVARLFRAAAEGETVHALGHFAAMGGVGTTADNLKDAVAGETHEYTEMYPPMLEQAQKEGHKGKAMIGMAMKVEAVHAELYRKALEAVQGGKDLPATEFYVCPICGHVEIGQPTARCPVCNALPEKYQKVG